MEDKEKETKRLNKEKEEYMKELERRRAALRTPEEQKRFEEMQQEQERLKAGILRYIEPHNPAYKELAVAAVAGLEERPHEDPELGPKQHKFCVVEHKAKSKKMQGVELKESVAEVDTDDFHAMRLAVSGGTKQVMIGTKKEKEALKDREKEKDAESEQGEEEPLADQYKTAYKKAKAALNSVSSELNPLEVVEGKLAEVVGHDEMKVAYKEQLEASMELLKNARQDGLKRFKAFPGKADSGDGAKA